MDPIIEIEKNSAEHISFGSTVSVYFINMKWSSFLGFTQQGLKGIEM